MPTELKFLAKTILFCLALSPLAASAAKPAYDAIYVFGDSYNDVGNLFAADGGAEPLSPPYFHGRFSNGPLWVEHLAGSYGLPMLPSLAGGTDYAFGGAWATMPIVTAAGTIPDVPQQVALYLSQHDGKADPKALYVLEGGGNDILGSSTVPVKQIAFEIASSIAESEQTLRRAGARNFLIPNFFNLADLPVAAPIASFATAAAAATNQILDELLLPEEFNPEVRIVRVDDAALFDAIETDTNHFGFTNVTTPCLNAATETVCADPDHTLFWDTVHPTEFMHGYFAVAAETVLNH